MDILQPLYVFYPSLSSLSCGISATALSSGPSDTALFPLSLLVPQQPIPGNCGGLASGQKLLSADSQVCHNRLRVQIGHMRASCRPNMHVLLPHVTHVLLLFNEHSYPLEVIQITMCEHSPPHALSRQLWGIRESSPSRQGHKARTIEALFIIQPSHCDG